MSRAAIERVDALGNRIGKNPLDLGAQGLEGIGVRRESAVSAIRRNCLDCMGGGPEAKRYVRECSMDRCPLWPFRMGKNPWDARTGRANPDATKHLQGHCRPGINDSP